MEIFELAAELGKKLKDDARLIALEDAKKAYESNAELKKYMIEYEVQQKAMQAEVAIGAVASKLNVGETSAPFKGSNGIYVIEVTAKNAKNAARSTGSMKSAGNDAKNTDAFLKGWDS